MLDIGHTSFSELLIRALSAATNNLDPRGSTISVGFTDYKIWKKYCSDEASAAMSDDINADTPILPAHIEGTVEAIAKLHADHHRQAGKLQRLVERLTSSIGRPRFIAGMTIVIVAWIAGNLLLPLAGLKAWDEPPFSWLQGAIGLLALYATVLILTTQRRDDQLAGHREQLTLELAILGEQKSAKIIALLEELRRDNPALRNRVDHEAAAMSVAADPQAVLDAIKETEI